MPGFGTVQDMVFRDRDSPITKDGLIFRVYGYDHPGGSCFCDLEYAPASLYSVETMKALREGPEGRFYKFYLDGGLKFASVQKPVSSLLQEVLSCFLLLFPFSVFLCLHFD